MGSSQSYHESSSSISPTALRVVNSLHNDTSPGPVTVKRPVITTSIGSIYDPYYLCNLISAVIYLVSPALAFIPKLQNLVLNKNRGTTVLEGLLAVLY